MARRREKARVFTRKEGGGRSLRIRPSKKSDASLIKRRSPPPLLGTRVFPTSSKFSLIKSWSDGRSARPECVSVYSSRGEETLLPFPPFPPSARKIRFLSTDSLRRSNNSIERGEKCAYCSLAFSRMLQFFPT